MNIVAPNKRFRTNPVPREQPPPPIVVPTLTQETLQFQTDVELVARFPV